MSHAKIVFDPYQTLLNYAFWLLGRRDYSKAEMARKLQLRAMRLKQAKGAKGAKAAIPQILSRLYKLGYLDDEKFARQWLSGRLAVNPKGKYLLRYELRQKGISRETFEKIWQKIGIKDDILADRILERKKRMLSRLSPQERKRKIMQLLGSRGISPSVIYDKIDLTG